MSDNNFADITLRIFPLCGITHSYNTGKLTHRKLLSISDDARVTGYSLCEPHDKLFKDGFIAKH